MNLRQKFILLLLFIGLVPTLLASVLAYVTIRTQLTNKTVDQLGSIAIKQEQKINGVLQGKQEEALKLANRYDVQLAISDYLTGQRPKSDDVDIVLRSRKTEQSGIQAIYLSNAEGMVLASTNATMKGKKIPVDDYNAKAGQKNSTIVREDPADGINKLFIATRMAINQQDAGILTLVYPIDDFVAALQDYTGLGSTGETLITIKDENGGSVSMFPLRFDSEGALTTNLDSLHLFDHIDSSYSGVTDYRGHQVLVTARSIGFADWVIATKLDRDEAFAPINNLGNTLIAIVVASSVMIVIVALYLTRFFTAPIIDLTEKTRSIMQGDFTQRITVTSTDEVGRLAASFNEMTEGLQASTRSLSEEHARLQASINSLDLGFLMISGQAQVVSCNPALLQILGLDKRTKLTLNKVQEQIHGYDLLNAVNLCLHDGKAFSAQEVSYGSRFLSVIGAPIRLDRGEIIGSVMVVEDITEAKILARSRDEFFSIASHELRTPLTAIKGNTRMVMDYYPELLKDDSVKEMLGDIHESSVRLIDIVNDFLDVSRIEQGKMMFKYEAFSVERVVESVVYEMKPVLNEKKLYLKFDKMTLNALPMVWADANRVKQIVYNLVGNAAKFTESGGITVKADAEKGMVHIMVSDTGRGIPLDKQELLFRKFQQAGNSLLTRDTTRGTGLGLYISKMLIERMGGHIALDKSEEGKGTTFSFTLPIATKEQQAAGAVEVNGAAEATGAGDAMAGAVAPKAAAEAAEDVPKSQTVAPKDQAKA